MTGHGKEDGGDGFIVARELFVEAGFELCEAAGQFPVRSERPVQSYCLELDQTEYEVRGEARYSMF